ncbi:MAG: helix-turn-helix domain-containing protein [Leptolyngbyaceae cyanobacterium]
MNSAQQEQLLKVGTYLKDLRQEKGKTVDEVANQIFIRPALVKAIEVGDWESLPEPVFVQGFILRYADYLGLNGREVSKQFEPTPVAVLPDPQLATLGSVEGVVKSEDKHGLKVLSKAEPIIREGSLTKPGTGNNRGLWFTGAAVVAAAIALIAFLTTRNTPQQANPSDPVEESAESAADNVADTAETTATAESEPVATNAAPITFDVNLEDDAWMRVTVDGEEVYEGTLRAGTRESWTAQNELLITAGNSGGVLYSFNGSEESRLGAPGTVSNLTLTPETDPETLPNP